jgi:DNA-binding transcriptional LysR family regulator
MDLRQLQVLVAIADHGSFSAAADALHTVQSNVSTHLARLERELQAQLVDRQTGRLTDEGEVVVERGRRIAAEIEAAAADVASLRQCVTGTARVGMIGTTARWLAPLLLDRMAAVHPGVHLVIGDGTSATLEPHLASGRLDAAVVNLPQTNPELVETPLFDEDLVLVVPAGHPLAARRHARLAELDGLELLLPASGTAYREEIDIACGVAGVTLRARAELDGLRLMASLALSGYGPAILPATGASEEHHGLVVVSVEGLPRRRVGMLLRRGRPSAPARAMVEVLTQVAAENVGSRPGLHSPAATS